MAVEKVDRRRDATFFSITEPKRYGEQDKHWGVLIAHSPESASNLPIITREKVENPKNDPQGEGVEKMQQYEVPGVGTVVFVNTYETETASATHQKGAHTTEGPFLLDKEAA